MQIELKALQGQKESHNAQMDRLKSERAELQSKLDLAGQKIANLERENMKLYKMTIEPPII
jgi:ribosomal protein L9